ncbi:gag/pol protein [Cucumis melo var. makuwa]|uniref:Gag/pol protein n=1 Tax=Cucumis melo var. makuwa TaxID=1194695 RepID=A0A5D3DTV3_CUCMM|nr:gag/pol protein [Cucumis melo var. makuwa]
MDSLREMFGQPSIQLKQEANVAHSKRFAPSSSGSKKIQKRKEEKRKGPTIAVEGKEKAKVVIKEKYFYCNVDEHWKTNCPKYLIKKKENEGATNHVCSSLQETSSFKQLGESEMTLKLCVGKGTEMITFFLRLPDHEDRVCDSGKVGRIVEREDRGEGGSWRGRIVERGNVERKNRGEGENRRTRSGLYDRTWNPIPTLSTWVVDEVGPSSRVDETTTSGQSHPSQSLRMPRRSGRVVSRPNHYLGLTETQVKAMDLEMKSMYFNSMWELVDLPEGLEGFITQGQEQKVCKLNRSIYGLKQASRSWNIRFDNAIKSYGFNRNVDEPCVYKKINKGKVAFLVLYVDDILLIGNDVGYLTDVKAWLAAQFQMKDLGEAQYVLGIQIIRDRKNKTLALSQAIYIDKMLVRYSMQNSKKGLLPFRHGVHLSKE